MRSPALFRAARSRRGFSLAELAIVLSVVGIILAGIWTYAGSGWQRANRQQAIEQVTAVVTGVRAAYLNNVGIGGGYAGLTQQAVSYNAISSQYVRTGASCTAAGTGGVCVDNPWGPTTNAVVSAHGSLGICGWTTIASAGPIFCAPAALPSTGNQYFAVELQGLSSDDCIALATQLSSPQGPSGLMDVAINTSSILGVGASKSLPVSVPDAENFCAVVPAAGYTILDFVYRLRAPAF